MRYVPQRSASGVKQTLKCAIVAIGNVCVSSICVAFSGRHPLPVMPAREFPFENRRRPDH